MGEIYSSGYTDIYIEFLWKNYWDTGNVEGQVKTGRITFKWMFGNGMSVQYIATEYMIRVSLQAGVGLFCIYHLVQTSTEIPTTCYHKNIRALCQKAKCPGCKVNYSHPSTAEVKNLQEVCISYPKTLHSNYNFIFTSTLWKWAIKELKKL
jgi:hypothetical protein